MMGIEVPPHVPNAFFMLFGLEFLAVAYFGIEISERGYLENGGWPSECTWIVPGTLDPDED